MTIVAIFSEYRGLPLPELPFPTELSVASCGKLDCPDVFATNVKVFESDFEKRQLISRIYISNGFILESDHIISKFPNGKEVHSYDRLIFSSPLQQN